jgi:hypothetical protein
LFPTKAWQRAEVRLEAYGSERIKVNVNHSKLQRHSRLATQRARISGRLKHAPQTVRFLQQAAPAFLRRVAKEYKRETVASLNQPQPKLWPDRGLHVAWLGHSSVLLKLDGFTILTDPVFSTRVGLNLGPLTVGIKRLVETAVSVRELPHVDLVLLSHAHMDHFDLPSLRQLENRRTWVITAHRTSDLLRPRRYAHVHELRWNETIQAGQRASQSI